MLTFGQYNTLNISRRTENGFYLSETAGDNVLEEVLLPKKFITPEMKEGDSLKVFVYKDSEDRPVATTQTPLATVGEAAYLLVKELTKRVMVEEDIGDDPGRGDSPFGQGRLKGRPIEILGKAGVEK